MPEKSNENKEFSIKQLMALILSLLPLLADITPWFTVKQRDKAKRIKLDKLKKEKTVLTTRTKPSEKRVKKLLKIEKQIQDIERDLMS